MRHSMTPAHVDKGKRLIELSGACMRGGHAAFNPRLYNEALTRPLFAIDRTEMVRRAALQHGT